MGNLKTVTRKKISLECRNFRLLLAGVCEANSVNFQNAMKQVSLRREQGLLINFMRLFFLPSVLIHLFYFGVMYVLASLLCLGNCCSLRKCISTRCRRGLANRHFKCRRKKSCICRSRCCGRCLVWLCRKPERVDVKKQSHETLRLATDLYMFAWTIGLLWSYFTILREFTLQPSRFDVHIMSGETILALAIPVIRMYEVFSSNASLHFKAVYKRREPMRALVNVLWHYGEVVIAFASFFLIAIWSTGESFRMPPPGELFLQPLYFSFVTITTLGYGDYSPEQPIGQCLVVFEVFLGMVLLVVVLQKVLGIVGNEK